MTQNMTCSLFNIVLNFTNPTLLHTASTQMNTLCGLIGVLHNSNLDAHGIMLLGKFNFSLILLY